jgi:hypothetical protein
MAGDIGMNNHTIHNANLDGSPYIDNVKTNGVFPPDANFAATVQLISGGVHPRINGGSILTTHLLAGAVFMWWGRLDQLPPWLKVCDGTLGTPDLRSRFVLGADDDSNIGWTGGTWQQTTYGAGGHNHSGATQNQTLSSGNLPGLTAPSLNKTKIALLKQSLSANFPNDPKFDVIADVTMGGGGTYSGSAQHAHGINWMDDHQHLFDTASPYFRLHFVMFRSMQIN